MPGLAQVLVQGGLVVSGSESSQGPAVNRLRRLGVRVHVHGCHAPRPCPRSARWYVAQADVLHADLEQLSARRRGLAIWTPARCLSALLRRGVGIAVAGGRAASAAAAMTGWTLTCAGRDPTVVLGTAAPQLGGWARLGSGPHVVVEAVAGRGGEEEWGTLAPRLAVFLDLDDAVQGGVRIDALRALADSVPGDGAVLALAGSAAAQEALRGRRGPVEWLALERGADWWGADLRDDRGRYRFRAFCQGRFVVEVRLRVPGRRNTLSALAAVAACGRLDVPAREIRNALEEFAGVSRDFESRGSYRGVTLVDDEGRDPAAVGEALHLGRQLFGGRRIWAVLLAPSALTFEERDQYAAALDLADEVVLAESDPRAVAASTNANAGRVPIGVAHDTTTSNPTATPSPSTTTAEIETNGATGAECLKQALAAAGKRARRVASLDDAIQELDRSLEPGDVLVTLGAGDVGTISDEFIRRLPRDRPGR